MLVNVMSQVLGLSFLVCIEDLNSCRSMISRSSLKIFQWFLLDVQIQHILNRDLVIKVTNVKLIPNLLSINLNSQVLQLSCIMILDLIFFYMKFPIRNNINLLANIPSYYVSLLLSNWMVIDQCLQKDCNMFKISLINNILVNKLNYGGIITTDRQNITFRLIGNQN